jgi:hypothetical protein
MGGAAVIGPWGVAPWSYLGRGIARLPPTRRVGRWGSRADECKSVTVSLRLGLPAAGSLIRQMQSRSAPQRPHPRIAIDRTAFGRIHDHQRPFERRPCLPRTRALCSVQRARYNVFQMQCTTRPFEAGRSTIARARTRVSLRSMQLSCRSNCAIMRRCKMQQTAFAF